MTITPTAGTIIDPATNVSLPTSFVASATPYVYVRYNPVTKAILTSPAPKNINVRYCAGSATGGMTATGGILACDTYANLQAESATLGLVGNLSADPTPKA